MDGSLEQLMRLLANRGLEWLRQRVMDLPDPCPLDHPDVGALALAGQAAPALSGLRGRMSPLEVIVRRRLTPDLVRAASGRVLAGDRNQAVVDLVIAGGLVTPADPLWELARATLAEDPALPLALRLGLSDDPRMLDLAEQALTRTPDLICSDYVTQITTLLMQVYRFGAHRPRLTHPRAFTRIFEHLLALARWSLASGCTASVARIAFCLRLVDPDHDIAELIADLIQVQRPDGSFPARLGFSTQSQAFGQAVTPTVLAVMALHMAGYRRWQGPASTGRAPQPWRGAVQATVVRVTQLLAEGPAQPTTALHAAIALTRASGENWLARLDVPAGSVPDEVARLCFADPIAARHLRAWLGLRRQSDPPQLTRAQVESAWLAGAAVTLRGPLPPALLWLWDRSARSGDETAFLECTRIAQHHAPIDTTPQIRATARRIAARALQAQSDLPAMVTLLDALLLLAHVFDVEERVAAAA